MSIEYTRNNANHRIQIEYIQIFPAKKEVHISGVVFDKEKYDFRNFSFVLNTSELSGVAPTLTALQAKVYAWLSNNSDSVLNVDKAKDYTRPQFTIDNA